MLRTSLLVTVVFAALSAADPPAPLMSDSSGGMQPGENPDVAAIFTSSLQERLYELDLELGTVATTDLERLSHLIANDDAEVGTSLRIERARAIGYRLAHALAARREEALGGVRLRRYTLAEAWFDLRRTDLGLP